MKKFLFLSVCLFGLTACDPVTTRQATEVVGKVTATVKTVQAYTRQYCQFLPTASTVIALINAAAGAGAAAIGGAVCEAVTTNPLAEGDKPGYYKAAKVRGVTIKGKFIR